MAYFARRGTPGHLRVAKASFTLARGSPGRGLSRRIRAWPREATEEPLGPDGTRYWVCLILVHILCLPTLQLRDSDYMLDANTRASVIAGACHSSSESAHDARQT